MYKNILVPVLLDDEHDNSVSFDVARTVARDGATFTLLHVVEAIPSYVAAEVPHELMEKNRANAAKALDAAATALDGAKTEMVVGHAGRTIVDFAQSHDIDCIVIASHKPGLEDYFLGSTASRVVRHAPCAVHVIR